MKPLSHSLLAALTLATSISTSHAQPASTSDSSVLLIGAGDSLTHGTMDATNNWINTLNAYLQRVAIGLSGEVSLHFSQPFFTVEEKRIRPFRVPTNLAVDGADAFTVEGIQYYKRIGTPQSFLSLDYISENRTPAALSDDYDKVLFPINLWARRPITQIGAAEWLLRSAAPAAGIDHAILMFWIGNNDSSSAALGLFGSNPIFLPLPFEQVAPELQPGLAAVLGLGRALGLVSFAPYSQASIERNLTNLDDFQVQMEHLIDRVAQAGAATPVQTDIFVCTLPYYSAVGYLFDSEDIEFYLQKLDPSYAVPPTFQRVAPVGEPISDPLKGDRISLLTFGMMYTLMSTGHSAAEINEILEKDGQQQDGLVMSEAEQQIIMTRIDGFNDRIENAVQAQGDRVHLVDIGQLLNEGLAGSLELIVNGRQLTRKWTRGGAFSLDGVHPGYTGQTLMANFVLEHFNAALGLNAPLTDLNLVHARDPYVDQDGDGWAPGPEYQPSGLTELMFLFTDVDDADPVAQVELPPDVWELISSILLEGVVGEPALHAEAQRRGLLVTQ